MLACAATLCLLPAAARGQDGVATTGAPVLQLVAGSRAPALSGAYTAISGDADAIFFNPAGIAWLGSAASLAYQRHVEEIVLGSAAGAVQLGRMVVGLGAVYLDAGELVVIEPDPVFGGQRGRETGAMAGARESAARLAIAVPYGPLAIGGAVGVVTSDLAGVTRSAPYLDIGAQYVLPAVTIGAALRNMGGPMTGGNAESSPLPSELRAGAAVDLPIGDLGALIGADLVSDLRAGTLTMVTGVEAGLRPGLENRIGAVGRLGYAVGSGTNGGLASLRVGGGLTIDRLSFDYTYQELRYFGGIHRVGLRWVRPAR